MTSTLLKKVKQIRYIAILLLSVCAFGTAKAQEAATSDEINEKMVFDSMCELTWVNDDTNPWYLIDEFYEDNEGQLTRIYKLRTPDLKNNGTSSKVSMSYSSEFDTALYFESSVWGSDENYITVLVDGEQKKIIDAGDRGRTFLRIPAGSHTVEFVVTNRYGYIYGLWVGEAGNLESQCVKEGSVPVTIKNDATYPWVARKGFIQSTNFTDEESTSKIFTPFTLDETTALSFECRNVSYGCTTNIYIDGNLWDSCNKISNNDNPWQKYDLVLEPGPHTLEFENVITGTGNITSSFNSQVRNINLKNDWIKVTVTSPGQFVANLVDAIGDKSVLDVAMLKITGSMNEKDMEGIKQLKNIVALDLSGTNITSLPKQAFYGLSSLLGVNLPESLKTIGESSFVGTSLTKLNIPANVERIESNAFSYCSNLKYVNFTPDSQLKFIGLTAFNSSGIKEFKMPDSVYEIESRSSIAQQYAAFSNCKSLEYVKISKSLNTIPIALFYGSGIKNIDIPEGVTSIDSYVFYGTAIEELKLPESLRSIANEAFSHINTLQTVIIPQNVTSMGSGVFSYCPQLKEATLNSHTNNLNRTFKNCPSLETVNISSVTPPMVIYNGEEDPFYEIDKDAVTVLVPEFALAAYKADPYWFQFRNLKSSAEVSTSDFWAIHGHLKLNSSTTLSGTPSIEIEAGGILDVAANTPLALNEVTYSNQEAVPAVLLNESDKVSATSLTTKFSVPNANKWYFFSPVTDVKMADVTYPATDSWVIRYYDGARRAEQYSASGNWVNMPADGTLKRGQGYIIQAAAAGTLYLPSATTQHSAFFGIAEAPMTLADNSSSIAEHAGWNLVGNPYPAFYDIYSMDLEAPITVWDGSTYRAYSLSEDDYVLRPMQPFFVQKADAALSLGMPRSGRLATSALTRTSAPRVNAIDENRLRLNLEIVRGENESADDYTRIVLNESAAMAYEGKYDASKFMSMDTEVAQIYSIGENSHPLAINERPYFDGNAALGVFIPKAGETYRIAATRADRKAWLYDVVTGIEQDLTEADYIFTADKAGNEDARFSIRFAPASSTAVEGVDAASVKVVGGKGMLSVSAPADAEVAVYAADGSILANGQGSMEMAAAAGVYVVKVNGQGFKTIVK